MTGTRPLFRPLFRPMMRPLFPGEAWSPLSLFANGEPGAWYDPSDLTTLYQDSAGTIPVAADGDPVGLMLDKSQGYSGGVVNLLQMSERFDSGPWVLNQSTVLADTQVAPDGTTTADTLEATADGFFSQRQSFTYNTETKYTLSVYAKANTLPYLGIRQLADPNGRAWFDLNLGVAGASESDIDSTSITDEGGGWYRCSITFTTSAAISNNLIDVFGSNSDGATDALTGESLFVWGAQIEKGDLSEYQRKTNTLAEGGNHASQTVAASRPIYRTDGTLHWLQFDGVDDHLTTAESHVQPYTRAAAFRALAASDFLIDGDGSNSGSIATVSGLRLYSGGAGFSAPYTPGSDAVCVADFNAALSVLRINGAETAGNAGLQSIAGTTIGASGAKTASLSGRVYGILSRSGLLTASEIAQLNDYLAQKAGVTL